MSKDFIMPTPEEIQAGIAESHRLRSEFVRELVAGGFAALRSLPSRIATALHLPAHS